MEGVEEVRAGEEGDEGEEGKEEGEDEERARLSESLPPRDAFPRAHTIPAGGRGNCAMFPN